MPETKKPSGSSTTHDTSINEGHKGGRKGNPSPRTHGHNRTPDGQHKSVYRKIHPAELPTITADSGSQISLISAALTAYCQKELGPISEIFEKLAYNEPLHSDVDLTKLGTDADPHGLELDRVKALAKRNESENFKYELSKPKLIGVLNSITTKEVDDKLTLHIGAIRKYIESTPEASTLTSSPTASSTAVKMGDINTCPLTRWRGIVFVTTSKSSGNKRIDQDTASMNFANLRQRGNESTTEFLARFRILVDTFSMLGLPTPSESVQAMRFTQGLDSARYGTMQAYFANEMMLKRDLYSHDLSTAAEIASTWMISSGKGHQEAVQHAAFSTIKQKPDKKLKDKNDDKGHKGEHDAKRCEFCGKTNHIMADCFKFKEAQKIALSPPASKTTGDQKEYKGKNAAKKKTSMFTHTEDASSDSDDDASSDGEDPEYMVNSHFMAGNRTVFTHTIAISTSTHSALSSGGAESVSPTGLILDSGANASLVRNSSLVRKLHSTHTTSFDGLAGKLDVDKAGRIGDLCKAYYHPQGPANIISFSQLRSLGHTIEFYPGQHESGDAFHVQTATKAYIFSKRPNGLYVYEPYNPVIHITTTKENEARFSKREVALAQQARELQRRLCNPPDNKLIEAINHGVITNPGILPADIKRATTIYGPSLEALKGRTTTKKADPFPVPAPRDRALEAQLMYVDIFTANGISFLITVVKPIGHIKVTALDKPDVPTLRRILRHHLGHYGQRGLTIRHLYSDNERGILAMASDFAGSGIELHPAGPGMHVAIIERFIRYVKEGVRGTLSGLPFKCFAALFKHLVSFVADRLNIFPSSTRTDKLSAHQLLYNRTPDARKDINLEFAAYYQVTNRLSNNTTSSERTIGALGISQWTNGTGTCSFLKLSNGEIFSGNHFVQLPMTDNIIAVLNGIAARDKRGISSDPDFTLHGHLFTGTERGEPTDLIDPTPPTEAPTTIMDTPGPAVQELWDTPPILSGAPTRAEGPQIDVPTVAPRGDDKRTEETEETEVRDTGEEEQDSPELATHSPDVFEGPIRKPIPTRKHGTRSQSRSASQPPEPETEPLKKRVSRPPSRYVAAPLIATMEEYLPSIFQKYIAAHITAKRAIGEDPAKNLPPIILELTNLVKKETFHGRHWESMTQEERRNLVRSAMNVTNKVSPTSEGEGRVFDKTKARLVVDGSQQERSLYTQEETSAPTVSNSAIMIVSQVAGAEHRLVVTIDIACAYLNAPMPTYAAGKTVNMLINPQMAALLYKIQPELEKYRRKDGSVVVELDKALYGCLQSAQLWYQELSSTLEEASFKANPSDICVFNRMKGGKQTTIAIYVDDLLVTTEKQSEIDSIIALLTAKYKEIKVTTGDTHNYVGIVLRFIPGGVIVNQTGMVEDIIKTAPTTAKSDTTDRTARTPTTPAADYLFKITPGLAEVNAATRKAAHSTIAKILFIAGRGRPDLLTLIALLTKRVKTPTAEDTAKLARGIAFMESTKNHVLTLACVLPPAVRTYIDASFAVHPDKKSHTGVCITLGTGMYYCKSTAQKINTTSSCESELVALAKGLQQALWSATFLENQGYKRQPVTVLQDNVSTMKLIEKGRSTSEFTRHIEIAYFWVHDLVKRNIIKLEYCPTTEMFADYFTKPLQGATYKYIRGKIMGDSPCVTHDGSVPTRDT